MAKSHNPERTSYTMITEPAGTTYLGQDEQLLPDFSKKKSRSNQAFKFSSFLLAYTICCIALSVVLALVVNGFNAADNSIPRYIDGRLQLRVSDITTLISAGLVVIKLLVSSCTAIVVWRCAYEMTRSTDGALGWKRLSFMTNYKLPPSLRHPVELPQGSRGWIVFTVLFLVLPQQFIAPLLSGAVNWSPTSVPGLTTVLMNSTNPLATPSIWFHYLIPTYVDKRNEVYKIATGLGSLSWSDSSTVSQNGTSLTGNGCRHVVNNDGLRAGSILRNLIVPCIKFHNISWAISEDQIPFSHTNTVFQKTMSIINDSLSHYSNPGHAVLFDPNLPWDNSQESSGLPPSTLFSGTKVLALNIAHTYNCTQIGINIFGDINGDTNTFPQHIVPWALGTCYIFANVTFTAGVTTSPLSTYLLSRVVEDQTPIEEVIFEPNPWVQQSLWLLPDLMTVISLANSSQLPTWHNVDLYAENLIRQSYLAAWASLDKTFDNSGTLFSATPAETRIQAKVSYPRVIAWLAFSLLTTFGGILLLVLSFEKGKLDSPDNVTPAQLRDTLNILNRLGFF